MAQKTLNEQQLRKYVENEVRNALLNEGIDEGFLSDLFEKLPGFSWEAVISAVLGHIAIAPILRKLLNAIGIPCDGKFGRFITNAVADTGMAYVGDWIDKNHNLIGR